MFNAEAKGTVSFTTTQPGRNGFQIICTESLNNGSQGSAPKISTDEAF